ncbi:hypothetical protein GG344DRAFT_79617 [Lentinula edodes]|nr:hypothetical protein GG344DRAFT_79617 [Lentinula edodes]
MNENFRKEDLHEVIRFYCMNHFHRIGHTRLSLSRQTRTIILVVDGDAETVHDMFPFDSESMSPEQYKATYPLHAYIRDTNGEHIVQEIQAFYEIDDSSLHVRDNLGFTPIFVAALKSDTNAIRNCFFRWMYMLICTTATTSLMISQVMPGNTLERSQAALKEEYVTEYSLKQAMGDQDVAGWQSLDQYIQIREYGCNPLKLSFVECDGINTFLLATAELYGHMIEDAALTQLPEPICSNLTSLRRLSDHQFRSIDESYEHEEHWINLVKYANDEKFSLVREKIGLDPRKRWGPYFDCCREDDIDSEDGEFEKATSL